MRRIAALHTALQATAIRFAGIPGLLDDWLDKKNNSERNGR
jgi:hypothetical protein